MRSGVSTQCTQGQSCGGCQFSMHKPITDHHTFSRSHPSTSLSILPTLQVFNFDPLAPVTPGGAGVGPASEEDMTKLCNHRRKAVAMATLYRSMETTCSHSSPGECLPLLRKMGETWGLEGGWWVSDLRRPRVESMENSLVRKDMVVTCGSWDWRRQRSQQGLTS